MKTSLITGAAGFIGSHLVDYLLGKGERVIGVDNLSSGSISNLRHLLGNERFELHLKDVTDLLGSAGLMDGVDEVYHLAATVGVDIVASSPLETIRNNINSTMHVLDIAAKWDCKTFLASSSEVYGPDCRAAHNEDDQLHIGPTYVARWAYAYSKATSESIAFSHMRSSGLDVVIGRLFNVVGPRQSLKSGSVLPAFVVQAMKSDCLTVHGRGSQQRCFIDVRDAVRLISDVMAADRSIGQIINIGSLQEMSIRELADKVVAQIGSEAEIRLEGYSDETIQRGVVERRVPDVRKLESITGTLKVRPIEHSIGAVMEWVAENSGQQPNMECGRVGVLGKRLLS